VPIKVHPFISLTFCDYVVANPQRYDFCEWAWCFPTARTSWSKVGGRAGVKAAEQAFRKAAAIDADGASGWHGLAKLLDKHGDSGFIDNPMTAQYEAYTALLRYPPSLLNLH
jgi:hypothetical protein